MLTPDINEIYPGTRGSTHGERNESNPPAKAISMLKNDTFIKSSYSFPDPADKFNLSRLKAHLFTEATFGGASSISFLIILLNAAISNSLAPMLMKRTTPRRSIRKVVGMLETE